MKKEYQNAQIDIIVLGFQDLIITSPEDNVVDMPGFGETFED